MTLTALRGILGYRVSDRNPVSGWRVSGWRFPLATGLGVIIALAIAGCSSNRPLPPKPTPTAAPTGHVVQEGQQIVAEGKVTPVKSAALSFPVGGNVKAVPATVGEKVEAGQTLVQLDTGQLDLQLAQADANLAMAQAKLNQLAAGPAAPDLAAAQQNLASAQAAYDKLGAGGTASDTEAARAALAAAQQNYAKVRAGPSAEQLAGLAAQLDNAQAALSQAQAAYDQVKSNADVAMLPQSLALQQATNNYDTAVAAYKDARAHPTAAELAAAESQVQQAQAALDRLTPDASQREQAQAAVQNAKAQLAKLQPSAEDRAVLEAGVKTAQAARDLAAEQLKVAKLAAPFAGTVMTVDIQPGEYAAPGAPVLRLADTSAWQIETTDVTELNIDQVSEESPVTMTFDAVPGLELPGHVSKITPYGDSKQGDVVYTVIVSPDQQDARLRWNMTAKVNIQSK